MKHIAILFHPRKPETQTLAQELAAELRQRKATAWCVSAWDEAAIMAQIANLDLVVTLGGDGSLLRAARIAAPHNVPLLGVNFGRLGFLSEVRREEALSVVPLVLDGEYRLEKRMMLHAELVREGQVIAQHEALNDIFVGRGPVPKAVHLTVTINGDEMTTYVTDGAVVASPTGSTAYALSAGGPVMDPRLRALLFVPIVPHLTVVRAVVLPATALVRMDLRCDYPSVMTVDGQVNIEMKDRDAVVVSASRYEALFLRLQPSDRFYATLVEKLG